MTCGPRSNPTCLPRGNGFGLWLHCAPCRLHLFRTRGRSGLCPARSAPALHPDVPQPHRHGTSPGHHERGRVGNAAGPGPHRFPARSCLEATLPAFGGGRRGASRRTWRRSAIAVPADQKAGLHICPHRSRHCPLRSAAGPGKRNRGRGTGRGRTGAADRFKRHEPLRERHGYPGQGSESHRTHSGHGRARLVSTW